MKVFYGFNELPQFVRPVVTMGSYDGVHLGHRELLKVLIREAKSRLGDSVVITFHPHPREVLYGEKVDFLTTIEEKAILLDKMGVDNLIIASFTKEFSGIAPYDFVKDYLVDRIGVSALVIGFDHYFGHNKEGNYSYLSDLQTEFKFDVCQIPMKAMKNSEVSSTTIRAFINEGALTEAERFLGYKYFFIAEALPSASEGQNKVSLIVENENKVLPPKGDYEVMVKGVDNSFKARLLIGDNRELTIIGNESIVSDEKNIITFL